MTSVGTQDSLRLGHEDDELPTLHWAPCTLNPESRTEPRTEPL